MASVFIDNYHIYYSFTTGKVKEFEEIKDGDFTSVVEDYDAKLQDVVNRIMKSEAFKEVGYPAFVKTYNQQNREVTAKS